MQSIKNKLVKVSLVFLVILLSIHPQINADHVLLIDDFNPKTTNLGIFNSFKYHTVILAITQKNRAPFNCQANRYIFYDYKNEDYFEVAGGNLKISGDYKKIAFSSIHKEVTASKDRAEIQAASLKTISSKLNISMQTLESGKSISTDNTVSCWQQLELIDKATHTSKPFPFLLANVCKHAWCSEIYWIDIKFLQLWVQTNPKEFHMIRLNTETGDYEFKNRSPKYSKKQFLQLNAPRDNIVTSANLTNGSFSLHSKKGNRISLLWKSRPNKYIRVELIRAKQNKKAAEKVVLNVGRLIDQKKYSVALRLVDFGFWLKPDDLELRYEKLRVYASLMLVDNLLSSLKDSFTEKERFNVCKRLHLDSSIKALWMQKEFGTGFKKLCLYSKSEK